MKSGYLSLHMGCMRAGKSEYAVNEATKYADLGEKVLYICSCLGADRLTEGGDGVNFTSHSSSNKVLSEKVAKITCATLSDIVVDEFERIVIDEAQFFNDIVVTVLNWVDKQHKFVHVVGLDSTFKRTVFGHLPELIPHADYYEKFTAKCAKCLVEYADDPSRKYRDAIFTLLEGAKTDNVIQPGNEGYIPVCRYHHNL